MEQIELIKTIVVVIGAVCSMLVARVSGIQYQKLRADLLKQLDDALEAENKYQVYELFYMLTKQRMPYNEIKELIKNESNFESISALSNYPGVYKYENGGLTYKHLFNNKWFRWFTTISLATYSIFMMILVASLMIAVVNTSNFTAILILYTLVLLFSYIGYSSAKFVYDEYRTKNQVTKEIKIA